MNVFIENILIHNLICTYLTHNSNYTKLKDINVLKLRVYENIKLRRIQNFFRQFSTVYNIHKYQDSRNFENSNHISTNFVRYHRELEVFTNN